jgi:hypothetical protein
VSKHLALLHSGGLLSRRREGLKTVYAISDPTLERICEIVCASVSTEARTAFAEIHAPRVPRHRSPVARSAR